MSNLSLLQKLKTDAALFALLIIAAAALFLSNLGAYRDFARAESYFALGAREMVAEGNWLAPHAPDEEVLNKPPLQYWLTGFVYASFGASYGAARLPSALAAIALLAVVYLFCARLFDKGTGLIALAVLATSYLFYTFARTAMSDMLLALTVSSAILSFILVLTGRCSKPEGLVALCGGYVLVALGVLAKGPVAIVLVGGPLMLELLISRDFRILKRLRIPLGTLIVLAVAGPYFLLLYLKLGVAPLRSFFITENLQRFTGEIYAYGRRPLWYLPLAFIGDFAPWSLLLFPALFHTWRQRRSVELEERRRERLIYLWLLFPLLFFSFSNYKLDYYLLPAMPAAAIIVGRWAARAQRFSGLPRLYIYVFTTLFALLMIVAAIISIRFIQQLQLDTSFGPLAIAAASLALLFILYCIWKGWARLTVWSLIAAIWFVLLLGEWTFAPMLSRYQTIGKLAASIPANAHVYTSAATSDWSDTLAFHLRPEQKVVRLASDKNVEQLEEVLRREPDAVALLKEDELLRLQSGGIRFHSLAEGETFAHGGLTLKLLRNPQLEHLRIVQSDVSASEKE